VATGPAGLEGWANADAIAVVPPGAGFRGDVVELLDVLGREGRHATYPAFPAY
jgi:hypothetical protein